VSLAAIALCVASQRVFIVVYFVRIQSGNFWIHHRRRDKVKVKLSLCFLFVF
jgi:hypothetical protein